MDRALKPGLRAALRWPTALAALAALAVIASSLGCASGALPPLAEGPPGDLLFGRAPVEIVGTRRADRLTDGRAVPDGDGWDTDRTARLLDAHASVTWDLGEPVPVVAVWLQGDNNDRYTVSGSLDGVAYEPLYAAGTVQGGGLRARLGRGLRAEARYLRLTATGGDGAFGVAELAVFGARSDPVPPRLEVAPGGPVDDPLRVRVVLLGVALCLFAGLARRGMPVLRLAALALLPLAALGWLALGLATLWPPDSSLVSLVRATMAGVGLFVLAREAFAPARHPAEPRATVPALGVAALVAAACFWNLGHPQFYDSARDRSTFVHYRDLRVYYPSAKYHDELGYDGVYLASLGAYADDVPGAVLADKEVRDLRDHELRRGADLAAEIPAVRARFSDARWATFRADMRYFREAMGVDDYLDSLRDHGANATPLWMALAKLVFAPTEASHTTLLLSALLDPLLLALMFVSIGRTFGWRTMLVALLVFGATDFYMYGSNWGGATLRHDWMVALGLGLCALERRRMLLGGALLAWAGMLRAFPALALVALLVASLHFWRTEWRRLGHRPTFAAWRAAERPTVRALAGAALAVAVGWLFSSLVLGFGAWPAWFHKVLLLEGGMHVNHLGLRSLFALDPGEAWAAIRHGGPKTLMLVGRLGAYLLALLAYLVAAVVALRGKRPVAAAVLGLVLIPVVFYPANYYSHGIFLWALLVHGDAPGAAGPGASPSASPRLRFVVWAILCAMCIAQYPTTIDLPIHQHFYWAGIILFAGLSAILVALLRDARRARRAE